MVAGYREQVLATLVPLATQLRTRQAKRLGLDTLKYYDEPLAFRSGNAVPAGDVSTILQQSLNMFQELSPETGAFFSFMVEKNLLDLVAKAGKAGGGYCAYISKHRAPFIFANFNGTSGDIDTLTMKQAMPSKSTVAESSKLPSTSGPPWKLAKFIR